MSRDDNWIMTTRLYRQQEQPHSCQLPPVRSVDEGDIATCTECGRWWLRTWNHHEVRPIWTRITRWRAWRLRRSGRFREAVS